METAIGLFAVVAGLVLCIGAVIVFASLCGWAAGCAARAVLGGQPAPQTEEPTPRLMSEQERRDIANASQRMLRECQQREAFSRAHPL